MVRVRNCNNRSQNVFLPAATKLGQGNIFTSVCQEFCPHGGGGVCLSACWDTPPQTRQTPGSRHHPPWDQADPKGADPPSSGKQTPAYGLRAAGTHPTGMDTCLRDKFHCEEKNPTVELRFSYVDEIYNFPNLAFS